MRMRDLAVWWVSTQVFGSFRYRAHRGLHSNMNVIGGLGFIPSKYLTPEEEYLDSLDFRGRIVFDIGAYIGLRTLFFASRADAVFSYEPNRHNRRRLQANLAANPNIRNVTIRPIGLGDTARELTMLWNEKRPGECVVEDSGVGRMIQESGAPLQRETVPVSTLDREVQSLPSPDFIKIDVEGLELDVLRGGQDLLDRRKPDLFIELHGSTPRDKVENATAIVQLLTDLGYRIHDVENQRDLERSDVFHHAPSHIHCVGERSGTWTLAKACSPQMALLAK